MNIILGRIRPILQLVLLIATIATTMTAYIDADVMFAQGWWPGILSGWEFGMAIMLILGAHEMGHYFAAQWHLHPASLPYFIPMPAFISPLGTLGSVITIEDEIPNRAVLFDIAAAGPLAGLAFALPILTVGLLTSTVDVVSPDTLYLEGNSILYASLKRLIFGASLPLNGIDVQLNQLAWAGWCGLLLTALNLLPVGQLDGGHIAYAVFGKRANYAYLPVIIALFAISIAYRTPIWLIWIAVLILFGRRHAQPLDDTISLNTNRRIIAAIMLLIFILIFVPIPLHFL